MQAEKIYKVGAYCRLSSDDGNQGDSSSIQTQKAMIDNYCKTQGFIIYNYYLDDGFSGANFNRPAFQRLIEDIEQGHVNLVITKDLSRLGREYIQTGYYSEIYFASKNVRYIAINDNIDTLKNDNDIAPFKNILNDMYIKDISKKIKSAKRQRALNGLFIGSEPPFGYKRDPLVPNHLIVDEEASKTVKVIFDLFLNGKGISAIRKYLAENKHLTPSAYKSKQGSTRFDRFASKTNWEYNWLHATIRNILNNIVYTGDLESRKTEIPNYKSKKRIYVDKENRIYSENTHEAIITKDDYERVRELTGAKVKLHDEFRENLFKGIVYCKVCGHKMTYVITSKKGAKNTRNYYHMYRCENHFSNRDNCPKHNFVNYLEFKELIFERIKHFFSLMKDNNKLIEIINKKNQQENLHEQYQKEELKITKRLDSLINLTAKVYDDSLENLIDNQTYYALLKKYQEEQKSLNTRLSEIKKYLSKNNDLIININELKKNINEYLDFKELTREMVLKLISKIIIEPFKMVDGKKTQEITIYYRFINLAM